MQFNLSDKKEIQNYIFNKVFINKEGGDITISLYISEGFIYDVYFHIGAYTIGQIFVHGMDRIFDIIYDSICKKICAEIESDLNMNNYLKN